MNESQTESKEITTPLTFGLMKYVHTIFVVGTISFGWLLLRIVETVWVSLNLQFAWVRPLNNAVAFAASAIIAVGVGIFFWRHAKVNRLAIEVVTELSKVSWPTRKELYASTGVVLVLSSIAALILSLFDFFWSAATDWMLGIR